jgi:hypothetical protein
VGILDKYEDNNNNNNNKAQSVLVEYIKDAGVFLSLPRTLTSYTLTMHFSHSLPFNRLVAEASGGAQVPLPQIIFTTLICGLLGKFKVNTIGLHSSYI